MKNNLVKILATLGLIVAIALVLKGVFGVGKIGFKNLFSKTYVKFDRCYPPDEYKNFDEFFLAESKSYKWEFFHSVMYFEIDLKRNVVITTYGRSDEAIKRIEERHNIISPRIKIDTYPIISSSKKYIRTDYMKPKSDHKDMGTEYSYTFNLESGTFEINARDSDTHKMDYSSLSQCEVY